jgi:outer membrane protein OmpA-like peptidoglycan-associated protein
VSNLGGHSRIVRLSRFSPAEEIIATGSYDGTIRIWKKEERESDLLATVTPKESDNQLNTKEMLTEVAKKDDKKKPEPEKNKPILLATPDTGKPEIKKEPKITFNEEEIVIGKPIPLKAIEFQQSSYVLVQGAYLELDKLVKFLKDNPKIDIEISGHTDNVGNANKNLTLSERRVSTVKFYILGKGIESKRLQTKAYGGTVPIADNSTEAGRKLNRRVEVTFLKM